MTSGRLDVGTTAARPDTKDGSNVVDDRQLKMWALVQERYGEPAEVLALRQIDRPQPRDDEVLIRVHASSVTPADWIKVTGRPYVVRPMFGLLRPRNRVAGSDVAGRVESIGPNVTRLRPGDEVFGEAEGAYAEYATSSESKLALKPSSLSYEEAAAVPVAAIPALQGLRVKPVQPGDAVLINGASGGVGTFAVQIAKASGAEVTAVCSTRNLDLVRALGADHAIDYTREDFTTSGLLYDVILDLVGDRPLGRCRRALKPGGVYISSAGQRGGRWLGVLPRLLSMPFVFRSSLQRGVALAARASTDDLAIIAHLIDTQQVVPVIDQRYELSEAREALQHQGEGHARGKAVIVVPLDE